MNICITGSLGLIGSAASYHFLKKGHRVVGIDNNMRELFFGKTGSTKEQLRSLSKNKRYRHYDVDIRNKDSIVRIFKKHNLQAIFHTAGQPSHDKAKEIPLIDFEVNTLGTLNILEAARVHTPKSVLIYTSTNKVYGDNPNKVKLRELKSRYDFADPKLRGFNENISIDRTTHSLMGSSKLAGEIYFQEYGSYFGLNTTSLRLGCVTGKSHAGVKLHGFLSFLVKSLVHNNSYEIIGYKGKQVRDQIHADDVAEAVEEIIKKPLQGEVFNLGGGRRNNASILELIEKISNKIDTRPRVSVINRPRKGDHICYITDYRKFKRFYPNWKINRNLESIITELIKYEQEAHINS